MQAAMVVRSLESWLIANGFRAMRSEAWDDPHIDRKFVEYVRGALSIILSVNGPSPDAYISSIAAASDGGKRFEQYTSGWARWMGAPLRDFRSFEDQAGFIMERIDDLERAVGAAGVDAVKKATADRRERERSVADEAKPLVRVALRAGEILRPEVFACQAWLAVAMHDQQSAGLRRGGSVVGLSLRYLVLLGDLLTNTIPTVPQLRVGIAQLNERGWLVQRVRQVWSVGARIRPPPQEGPERNGIFLALTDQALEIVEGVSTGERLYERMAALDAWLRAHPLPIR